MPYCLIHVDMENLMQLKMLFYNTNTKENGRKLYLKDNPTTLQKTHLVRSHYIWVSILKPFLKKINASIFASKLFLTWAMQNQNLRFSWCNQWQIMCLLWVKDTARYGSSLDILWSCRYLKPRKISICKIIKGTSVFFIRLFGSATFTATLKLVARVGLP